MAKQKTADVLISLEEAKLNYKNASSENKKLDILNEADENLAFWNFLKHRAPNASQHE